MGFRKSWLYQSKAFKNLRIERDWVYWDKPDVNSYYPELRYLVQSELFEDSERVYHCSAKLATFTKWLLRMNDYVY